MDLSNQNNPWIEISLPVKNNTEESIANFLFEIGAQGCHNQENHLRAYFRFVDWNEQKHLKLNRYLEQLIELGFSVELNQIQMRAIENQDWNAEWKKTYQPIELADRIIVRPSWIKLEPAPSKEVIEIDPQMAFGTGTHATTQLAIQLVLEFAKSPKTILDIGTGTGILSIIAARFFNTKVVAFDNDPIASLTALQNFSKNKVGGKISTICCNKITIKNVQFDLIMANINRSVIVQLLPEICDVLKPTGLAIFSGILTEERNKFIKQLNQYPIKVIFEKQQDEWLGLVVQKYR